MDGTANGATSGGCAVRLGEFDLVAGQGEEDAPGDCKVTIRPERVDLEAQGTTGENRIPAMVERVVYVGSVLQTDHPPAVGPDDPGVAAERRRRRDRRPPGPPITVHFPREALRVLPGGRHRDHRGR